MTQRRLDGAFIASATWFQRSLTDPIDFVSCPRPLVGICLDRLFGTYNNILNARAKGVELSATLRPVEALQLQADYTWTDAR